MQGLERKNTDFHNGAIVWFFPKNTSGICGFQKLRYLVYMKKIATLLITTLFALTGCFGLGDDSGDESGAVSGNALEKTYETAAFALTVPTDWEVLEAQDLTSNTPVEMMVAFRNNIKDPFYTSTVVVTRHHLSQTYSSLDFAKLMIQKHGDTIFDYTELGRESLMIARGETEVESLIFSFQGRATFDGDLVVVREMYFADGPTAYVITAGHKQNEDEGVVIQLMDILKSFVAK
jgi:hypothetical protein